MTEKFFCVLDYETRSEADLKKVGGYEYANDPTTEILSACWRVAKFADQLTDKIAEKFATAEHVGPVHVADFMEIVDKEERELLQLE